MDAPNHLIFLFLSFPVYAAAHAIPFWLLPTSRVVHIIKRNQQFINKEWQSSQTQYWVLPVDRVV